MVYPLPVLLLRRCRRCERGLEWDCLWLEQDRGPKSLETELSMVAASDLEDVERCDLSGGLKSGIPVNELFFLIVCDWPVCLKERLCVSLVGESTKPPTLVCPYDVTDSRLEAAHVSSVFVLRGLVSDGQ